MASFSVRIKNREALFFFISRLIFILVIAFSVSDLTLFYIFFEASLIPITVIVLGWGYQPERVQARNYLVLYTMTARLPLLRRILYIGHVNRHISFFLVQWRCGCFYRAEVWWLITITAFLVKTPLYFFHL